MNQSIGQSLNLIIESMNQVAEQESHPLSEMPKLTVSMIHQKVSDLDGEVRINRTNI